MITEKELEQFKKIEEANYRYLPGWLEKWKTRILFTESGLSRISSIAGYVLALKHAGQEDLAIRMSNDLHARLDQLGGHDQVSEILTDSEEVIKVPACKAVLYDDGCLHSFSFVRFYPVSLKEWEKCVNKHQENILQAYEGADADEQLASIREQAKRQAIKELKIDDRLTEHRYTSNSIFYHKVYYSSGYNGGLIYHGPGSGETFSVLVGDRNAVLWSIHT